MRGRVRHPVTLVLGILRVLGGFPYRLRRVPRGSTPQVVPAGEHRAPGSPAGGGKEEEIVVERVVVAAAVWSAALALLLAANSALYLCLMQYGAEDTWSVIATLVQVSLCLVAAAVQVHLVLYSRRLARVLVRMVRADLRLTGGFLRRRFLALYVVMGAEMVQTGRTSLTLASKIFSGEDAANLPLYVSNFLLLLLYPPVSCLATYGLLHVVCITLDMELEERFLRRGGREAPAAPPSLSHCPSLLRDALRRHSNTILPVLATHTASPSGGTPPPSGTDSLEHLRGADWKALIRFLGEADDIVAWLMACQGPVLLLVSVQTLAATVTLLYGFLILVQEDLSYEALLTQVLRLLYIVCTPDILAPKRARCLRFFRRVAAAPASEAEAREAERVVSVLENGPSFSVCGLFSLGRHCIIPVLSSVATYLIIALQFRFSERTGGPDPSRPSPTLDNAT